MGGKGLCIVEQNIHKRGPGGQRCQQTDYFSTKSQHWFLCRGVRQLSTITQVL